MDTPRNIIADYLPPGPDEWIKDRVEHATGIIEALANAGYTIKGRDRVMDGIENEFRIRTMQTELIEENSALRAENERLKAERDDAREQRRKWQNASVADRAENERLRAALFRIIEDCHSIMQANEIARTALADQGKG